MVKEYWFNKGLACQMQEKYSKALEAYSEAINLDNNYQKAIDNRNFSQAKILQLQGSYQQAVQLLWQFFGLQQIYGKDTIQLLRQNQLASASSSKAICFLTP